MTNQIFFNQPESPFLQQIFEAKYTVNKTLRKSANGVIYAATDNFTKEQLVLKQIAKRPDDILKNRLSMEIQLHEAASRACPENIAEFYEYYERNQSAIANYGKQKSTIICWYEKCTEYKPLIRNFSDCNGAAKELDRYLSIHFAFRSNECTTWTVGDGSISPYSAQAQTSWSLPSWHQGWKHSYQFDRLQGQTHRFWLRESSF